jgi:hypothetical protein
MFDVEAMISDTNLGSIDNREYNPDDPNDPNNGTSRILTEPSPFFSYAGPGYEQLGGITLSATSLEVDFNDGNLASFVFTCSGEGDVTLSLKNYSVDIYPRLESILIHQVDSNSQQMMMGSSGGVVMESSSVTVESSQIPEDIDIDKLVAQLEEIWANDPNIRETITEDNWSQFIETVKNAEESY